MKQLKVPAGFQITKFAEGLNKPRMIALSNDGVVYVTDRDKGTVTMLRDTNKDGSLSELQLLLDDLPDGGQHPNRTLRIGQDNKLYISIGSTCNACDEPNKEHATILQADLDGKVHQRPPQHPRLRLASAN